MSCDVVWTWMKAVDALLLEVWHAGLAESCGAVELPHTGSTNSAARLEKREGGEEGNKLGSRESGEVRGVT